MERFVFAISLVLTSLGAVSLTSCGEKQDVPTPDSHSYEIKIGADVASRATDTGFDSGDCIGLYVVNHTGGNPGALVNSGNHVDNMRFTYTGTWSPDKPIYWLDNTTPADFYLYFPYSAAVNSVTAHPFAVATNQSTETNYKASDFMLGKKAGVAPAETAIVVPVSHLMSRMEIAVKPGNGFTAASLAAASIAVKVNGVRCNSTINLATAEVTPTGNATSVTPFHDGNLYKALIVPQTVEEGNLITVTADGRDFNLNKAFTFVGGKSHAFTVTLSKTSNGVNVTINPWGDDGTDYGGTAE